jgi:hypothetical protein
MPAAERRSEIYLSVLIALVVLAAVLPLAMR